MKTKFVSPEFNDAFHEAHSYFPELKNTNIAFIARNHSMVHFMNSVPVISSLTKSKEDRQYVVFLNYNMYGNFLDTLSEQAKIGWISHELEHIVEYESLSTPQIAAFGLKYFFSNKFKKEIERDKNSKLVARGLESEILAGINETLQSPKVTPSYKQRIVDSYLPSIDSFKPYMNLNFVNATIK